MSKLILAATALALTVAFAGCGKSSGDPNPDNQNSNGQTNTVPDGWIPIRTAAELDAIRNNTSVDYIGNSVIAANYILMNDIDLTAAGYTNWVPIGSDTTAFAGRFNGNGHKITGLVINNTTLRDVGLFSKTMITGNFDSSGYNYIDYYGSIRNLGVEIGAGGINGGSYVGGIVGDAGGSITNCYTAGNIAITFNSDPANLPYVGGIAGEIEAGDSIVNCHTTGNISSTIGCYAAGIAGKNYSGVIIDCYSTGNISPSSSDTYSYVYSSGIVGYNSGTIANCFSSGNISSTTTNYYAGSCSGGIAAESGGTILNCYSTGNISSSSTYAIQAYWPPYGAFSGGIVGDGGDCTITNCYSTGSISALASATSAVYPTSSAAGGIIANVSYNKTIITGCAAINNKIDATRNSSVNAGTFSVGRIAGYAGSTGDCTFSNNLASSTMAISANGVTVTGTSSGNDGTATVAGDFTKQATYEGIGWKFGSDDANPWKMGPGGYPVLYWQK